MQTLRIVPGETSPEKLAPIPLVMQDILYRSMYQVIETIECVQHIKQSRTSVPFCGSFCRSSPC
jgi:hypothetical protein